MEHWRQLVRSDTYVLTLSFIQDADDAAEVCMTDYYSVPLLRNFFTITNKFRFVMVCSVQKRYQRESREERGEVRTSEDDPFKG